MRVSRSRHDLHRHPRRTLGFLGYAAKLSVTIVSGLPNGTPSSKPATHSATTPARSARCHVPPPEMLPRTLLSLCHRTLQVRCKATMGTVHRYRTLLKTASLGCTHHGDKPPHSAQSSAGLRTDRVTTRESPCPPARSPQVYVASTPLPPSSFSSAWCGQSSSDTTQRTTQRNSQASVEASHACANGHVPRANPMQLGEPNPQAGEVPPPCHSMQRYDHSQSTHAHVRCFRRRQQPRALPLHTRKTRPAIAPLWAQSPQKYPPRMGLRAC